MLCHIIQKEMTELVRGKNTKQMKKVINGLRNIPPK